jgi:hypothetical protein
MYVDRLLIADDAMMIFPFPEKRFPSLSFHRRRHSSFLLDCIFLRFSYDLSLSARAHSPGFALATRRVFLVCVLLLAKKRRSRDSILSLYIYIYIYMHTTDHHLFEKKNYEARSNANERTSRCVLLLILGCGDQKKKRKFVRHIEELPAKRDI